MSWEPEIEELRRREALAKQMGGSDNVRRQHEGGKLTVRERIERLLDPGSFHETGALAGVATYENGNLAAFRPANFVMGTVGADRVMLGSDYCFDLGYDRCVTNLPEEGGEQPDEA